MSTEFPRSNEWLKQRVLERCMPEPYTGCWLWTGSIRPSGYGIIRTTHLDKYILIAAHRASFRCFKGEAGDAMVLHSCDVPLCVTPDHLRAGTAKDNSTDIVARNRQRRGSKFLTEQQIAEIHASRESNAVLARRFNCNPRTIRDNRNKNR